MIDIPKISTIKSTIETDISTAIGQTIPSTPKAFFKVLAKTLAGAFSLLWRVADSNVKQIFPQTANDASLDLIGGQYGLVRSPAVAAIISATVTGSNDTTIIAGTLWTTNGVVYTQETSVSISGGTVTVSLKALTTGANTNVLNGTVFTLVTPLAGVETATATETTTTGEDLETTDSFRNQVITRIQQRPQGGATPDYILWTLEVSGVVKAFAFQTALSTVSVYPLVSLTGTRIPSPSKLTEIQTYLNDTKRKPLCATVLAKAMTEKTLHITASGLQPNTVDMKTVLETAWANFLLKAFPRQYIDEVNATNVISLASLYTEASNSGASAITITMDIGAGNISAYTLADNEIIKLGVVTWG